MTSPVESAFRVIAACTSLMMILSPTPAVYKIYKTKSIGHTSIISLVSVFANCHVWTLHGLLTRNWFPVFSTFLSGDFISLIYMFVFLRYTPDRKQAWKVIAVYAAVLSIISLYALLGGLDVFTSLSSNQVNDIMGYLAVCVTLVLYSSPFLKVKEVIKYKTGIFIPIHMVLAGTFNNAMWITYTPMSGLWFLFVTNIACAILGVAQLTVYMLYHPSKHPLGFGATLEDLLAKEQEDDGARISVTIDRPSLQSSSKSKIMVNAIVENLFRVLASLTSISVTLSMTPSMYRIYRQKDTGIASVLPLVCMWANAHIWMLDGAIVQNWFPMFATFLTSDVISIIYVTTFICFARDRKKAIRRTATVFAILATVTVYALLGNAGHTNQSNDGVDMTLGIIGVLAGLSMFSSPFERMMKVLHYKSAAFIPIPLVMAGALNNVMWVVYSPMIESWFLFGGNALCLLVNFVNLILYAVYNPKTHPLRLDEDDPEALEANATGVAPVSLSLAISPLPTDNAFNSKTKCELQSPVYNALSSPLAEVRTDVYNRV
ncbi:hypothetical protein BBO99_00005083 [Phytophthora kernoviae]|uniref:MtN3-like protein n=2 Tax=Phytophthora kernoviae TaxID=325452 RepID=A0A3R7IJA2_9STRA|nr:hypothetical protein G195_005542 [Phytophthora kernoviae 00238/432]KAG2523524.1 hypothetical protein JM16_004792 [Phytophthora kernoviae]KAG2525378.1 hypothetical protein JM18_004405 [Phytophthora kernoviae]RLN21432.1 hypothetical protein BBI17_005170 [Phytophthora kernoviae]RLN79680.1 hypothetical protein BBO99_00005083 [Phytophthora kernoviae]